MTENHENSDRFGTAPHRKVVDDDNLEAYAVANDGSIINAFPNFVAMGVGYAKDGEHSNPAMVLRGEWKTEKGAALEPFTLFAEMPSADFVLEMISNLMGAVLSQDGVSMIRDLLIQMANAEADANVPSMVQVATQGNETEIRDGIEELRKQKGMD